MFSKAGPYLSKPEDTNKPKVIPNKYKLRNKNAKGNPNLKIEIPKNGVVNKIAGTNPINVLTKAVIIKATIISLNFIGAINKFVKFLLQISSKNDILKLILDRNKKSQRIAAVKITPRASL